MALIIPGASFIASFVLTVIAICGMKRAKTKASLSSNSNTDSSNVNSSGVMSQTNDKGLNISDSATPMHVAQSSKQNSFNQRFPGNKKRESSKMQSFWRSQTIAQMIEQYYTSSQLQITRKSTQILTLLLINVISITIKFIVNFYLTAKATNTFSQYVTDQQCAQNLNIGFLPIIAINVVRAISNYAPFATVYYFIYWKNRKAVRSDSQSSLDILLNQSKESIRNQSINDERTPLLPNLDDQNGEDLVGWMESRQKRISINKLKHGNYTGKKKLIRIKTRPQENIVGQNSSGQDNRNLSDSFDSIIQSNGRSPGSSSSSFHSSKNLNQVSQTVLNKSDQNNTDQKKKSYQQSNNISLQREKSSLELWSH